MIDEIIDRAVKGGEVGVDDVYELMSISDPKELETLYEAARKVRDARFGRKVFTYGFVYFSTYCKNNCAFCYFRRSNGEIERYRKDREEIVQLAGSLKDAGINLADLTMGEDPRMYADDYRLLLDLISAVHDEVGINTMASPGALPRKMPAGSGRPGRTGTPATRRPTTESCSPSSGWTRTSTPGRTRNCGPWRPGFSPRTA